MLDDSREEGEHMRNRLSVIFLAVLLVLGLVPPASGEDSSAPDMTYYKEVRSSLGFESGTAYVQRILRQYGLSWEDGFPLSPDEKSELERRLSIQHRFTDDVVLALEGLSGFAGFYFDHTKGGSPTLLTTMPPSASAERLAGLPDEVADLLEFRTVTWTYQELLAGAEELGRMKVEGVARMGAILNVSVDVIGNGLRVSVPIGTDRAILQADLGAHLELPVEIVEEDEIQPDTCTSRWVCHSPFRAGIGVTANGGSSTLGFAISNGSVGEGYLVAGHHSGTYFYHSGFPYNGGYVGVVNETLYPDMMQDAKFIDVYDGYVSNSLYVTSSYQRSVIGSKVPSVGLYVCQSGLSSGVRCGTVTDKSDFWWVDGNKVYGSRANYSRKAGDSGAPVYQYISGTNNAYAVGIHSAGTSTKAWFARMDQILGQMSASLVTS